MNIKYIVRRWFENLIEHLTLLIVVFCNYLFWATSSIFFCELFDIITRLFETFALWKQFFVSNQISLLAEKSVNDWKIFHQFLKIFFSKFLFYKCTIFFLKTVLVLENKKNEFFMLKTEVGAQNEDLKKLTFWPLDGRKYFFCSESFSL